MCCLSLGHLTSSLTHTWPALDAMLWPAASQPQAEPPQGGTENVWRCFWMSHDQGVPIQRAEAWEAKYPAEQRGTAHPNYPQAPSGSPDPPAS